MFSNTDLAIIKQIIAEQLRSFDGGNEILSLEQAVTFTGLSKHTIYGYVNRGFLPFYKSAGGRKLYFSRKELTAWMTAKKGDSIKG